MLYVPYEIPDFNLKFFNFRGNSPTIIFVELDKEFCKKVQDFFYSGGQNKGLAEEVGKRFFELKGFNVIENYRLKGKMAISDLTIIEGNQEFLVEMKSFDDKLSLKQLDLIVERKGLVGWLVKK